MRPGKSCRDILTRKCVGEKVGDGIYWISLNLSKNLGTLI
jgi:hypothetical protein